VQAAAAASAGRRFGKGKGKGKGGKGSGKGGGFKGKGFDGGKGKGKGRGKGKGKGGKVYAILPKLDLNPPEITDVWMKRPVHTTASAPGAVNNGKFIVLSWNTLSKGMHKEAWEERAPLIVRHVLFQQPHVVFLQEVLEDTAPWLLAQFRGYGFDGIYNRLEHGQNTVMVLWQEDAFEPARSEPLSCWRSVTHTHPEIRCTVAYSVLRQSFAVSRRTAALRGERKARCIPQEASSLHASAS
jgi:hypothetical protein